jgi:hypothetical protein
MGKGMAMSQRDKQSDAIDTNWKLLCAVRPVSGNINISDLAMVSGNMGKCNATNSDGIVTYGSRLVQVVAMCVQLELGEVG